MVMSNGLGAPLLMLAMLGMVVIPMHPLILDALFTFNIALALLVLLAAVYVKRPLDFGVFPAVLLIATLMRLALNVASTRIVLLEGHTGTDAAGYVIEAFGEFVIGGNYAVGIVVFAILVIINFVVVTKGAGRISEVSARFTLDSMPGKQMAIDADLNAGMIDADTAKLRRSEVVQEADFYGSMDGASKFVRGDAIAAIMILFITLIGGLAIGMAQHDMPFGEAVHNFSLLTIGDGLVAQIPSLLLSTAAAIVVTRVSSEQDMGGQVADQLLQPRALAVTAGIMVVMGVIPGMPNIAFLSLAALCGGAAYWAKQRLAQSSEVALAGGGVTGQAAVSPVEPVAAEPEVKELGWDDVPPVDLVGLEVGYRLIPMVDKSQGGELMGRIKGVRKKLSQELGFLIPPVHIRDNLDLAPNAYRLILMGVTIAEDEVFPDRDLALNPGQVYGSLQGAECRDPAFGLEAVWIEDGQKENAQTLGYTVVDPSTVVATHLSHILQRHAHELIGREEVQHLLDNLAKKAPKLVEELVPNALPLGAVLKVLQNLLVENVTIRDIRTIAETLADYAPQSKDPLFLTGVVRVSLGRAILQNIAGPAVELEVMTLAPNLEQILQRSVQQAGEGGIEPGMADKLHSALQEHTQRQESLGKPAILLVSAPIRPLVARFVQHSIPGVSVLSYNEVPDDKQIKIIATIG
ncbi:MAG: flagellar biosynthesis protein FlhA [Gammaproteobacteria bacterium]|nr:flagellar biosynthesis protein FlhA [Gammaproteobacteria bacterium]MCF6229484.1 flagellar biosynthesis protein FlhA [Gammaproteobacteria bacterium]